MAPGHVIKSALQYTVLCILSSWDFWSVMRQMLEESHILTPQVASLSGKTAYLEAHSLHLREVGKEREGEREGEDREGERRDSGIYNGLYVNNSHSVNKLVKNVRAWVGISMGPVTETVSCFWLLSVV